MTTTNNQASLRTLVLGATGGTGRHVTLQLLQEQQQKQEQQVVEVVVRSKQRFLEILEQEKPNYSLSKKSFTDLASDGQLVITEGSILELSDSDLAAVVGRVDNVVCCLGHTMDWAGLCGRGPQRRLVTTACQRLVHAIQKNKKATKLILMGSDGVAHPAGTDKKRPWIERVVISLIRTLITAHGDNEEAAAYVYSLSSEKGGNNAGNVNWIVVRPTDLVDGPLPATRATIAADVGDQENIAAAAAYKIYDHPPGSLFGSGVAHRSVVAQFMVHLLLQPALWQTYQFTMPVVHDKDQPAPGGKKKITANKKNM